MAAANPLPLRLGVYGHLEDSYISASFTPQTRFERLFDRLQATCLHAHGFEFPHNAFYREAAAEIPIHAQEHDIWTHFLRDEALAAEPAPGNPGYLVHANALVHARMAATAGLAGCRTYVLHPPRRAACSLEEFAQQVDETRDHLQQPAPALGLLTPPSSKFLLDDPAALHDFARQHGLSVVLHAGNIAAAGRPRLNQEDWHDLLHDVPRPGLFCYSAQRFDRGQAQGLVGYRGEARSEPRLVPFLRAIQARRCADDSLLAKETRNELEVVEILKTVATENGLDSQALLAQRTPRFPHRNLPRLA